MYTMLEQKKKKPSTSTLYFWNIPLGLHWKHALMASMKQIQDVDAWLLKLNFDPSFRGQIPKPNQTAR